MPVQQSNTKECLEISSPIRKRRNKSNSQGGNVSKSNADSTFTQTSVKNVRLNAENSRIIVMEFNLRSNIEKPQRLFREFIDNSDTPFFHRPNKMTHTNAFLLEGKQDEDLSITNGEHFGEYTFSKSQTTWFDLDLLIHPYQHQIDTQEFPTEHFLTPANDMTFLLINESTFVYVDTLDALKKTIECLKSLSVFSFDVEAHTMRSFMGFTCLLQISTRDTDYIIDPFPIWTHMFLLNEVFSSTQILKIAHGSSNDVLWLQRDFGVYTLNLFDTHCAMQVLKYPKESLSNLLETKCDVFTNKSCQRADWRVRPLPEAMLNYARTDAHFLLYLYDVLKSELLNVPSTSHYTSAIFKTFEKSKQITQRLYQRKRFDPFGYLKLFKKRRNFDDRQMHVLKELWRWRDKIARVEDESLHYVLPDETLLKIAQFLPNEKRRILDCCSSPPPPLVQREMAHLLKFFCIVLRQINKVFLELLNLQGAWQTEEKC